MHDTLRFWLDRGVDGFRMDVIYRIGKDPARIASGADDPTDDAFTHELVRRIRVLLDDYDRERRRVGVGEVYVLDTPTVATFYGHDDELHLNFNFRPQWAPWDAATWRDEIDEIAAELDPRGAWPTWVLSNHDIPRTASRLGNSAAARAAAVLLLTLRGTPFLYAGEELGLEDAEIAADQVLDPAGFRDGCRAPVPWDANDAHGWRRSDNWLPWPPDVGARNVANEREDPASILHLYRRLLARRRESVALRRGAQRILETPEGVLGFERVAGDQRRVVLVNFTSEHRRTALDGSYVVDVASDHPEANAPFANVLAPDQAVVLRPG
jgi:alpha-glucosidase